MAMIDILSNFLSSMKTKKCVNSLVEDLLIEILSLLPVKSVLRFKCVCKSWYDLFETPNFISKHLNNSINNIIVDDDDDNHRIIVQFYGQKTCFKSLSYNSLDVISEDLGFEHYRYGDMLGCYNGVVCMSNSVDEILLWNPTTRQIRVVPESEIPPFLNVRHSSAVYGYGYDFKTNDYKVLRICKYDIRHAEEKRKHQVEVYSLSTNSWRLIDAVVPDGIDGVGSGISCNLRASVNGFASRLMRLNERAREREGLLICLLTFDMSKELFIATPLTGDVVRGINQDYTLTTYQNSVAFITSKISSQTIQILVLDEYGPNGTWRKLYEVKLRPFDYVARALGLLENGDFLYNNGGGDLVMFDPSTRKSKKVHTGGNIFRILEYKESLVSLQR